jgi:hypothetical protein
MADNGQNTIEAVVMDRFGGPETLTLRTLALPEIGHDDSARTGIKLRLVGHTPSRQLVSG